MADGQATFKIEIEVDPGDIRGSLNRALDQAKNGTSGLDKEINKVQKSISGTGQAAKTAQSQIKGWAESMQKGFKQALLNDRSGIPDFASSKVFDTKPFDAHIQAWRNYNQKAAVEAQKTRQLADSQANIPDFATRTTGKLSNMDAHVQSFNAYNRQVEAASRQTAIYNQYLYDEAIAAEKARKSQENLGQSLSTTRYALYDVSSTLGITGAVLTGLAVATTAVAVAWERDFAQVARTSGATGDALANLREELVDLAQTMPVSFGDLTRIATLAGQLNVPAERIAAFTETVAKTVAVTDLSVDAAATAFGRLDALLPDVQGNYEALGSSIAKVGVNSVATESQIVNISTQISSMGNFAGLTAAEVVGLSGALASIGAAPELSRGTVTRLFTQMQKAISAGGDSLQGFAKIAGVSADEFASAFGTNRFGPIFQKFIEGLDDTSRTGGDATKALSDLGITSVRDVPLLLRLAGAGDILSQSFKDARVGFEEGSELNRQYGVIAQTTAARLEILANSFQALLDAIGSANLGALGDFADLLTEILKGLTDFVSTDIGGRIAGIVVILTGLIGILGIAAGAAALFGASSIGMQQALVGIATTAPRASAALLGAGNAAALASGEMKAATVGVKALGVALKALSVIGIVLAFPDIHDGLQGMVNDITGASEQVQDRMKKLEGSITGVGYTLGLTNDIGASFGKALGDIGLPVSEANNKIKELDDQIAEMANNGNIESARDRLEELRGILESGGIGASQFNILFQDAIDAVGESEGPVANGKTTFESLDQAMDSVEQQAQATEQALNELRDAVLNFGQTGINAEQAGINLQRALNDMAEAAANGEATLDGTNAASLTLRQAFIDTDKAARDAALAMIDNGATAEEATAAYMAQRQAIIDARVAKGEDATAAAAWADAVLGNASEAQVAIQQYSAEVNRVPETKVTRFYVDASGAYRDVNSLVDYINSRTATIEIDTVVYESAVLSGGRGHLVPGAATGGEIHGPGTGTSDSIMARLSNGEFVMKAAAVNKYGTAFMHAVNSGRLPKFANGGSVTPSAATAGAGIMTGVVELGPKTIKAISANVTVMLDDTAISRSAQRGDRNRRLNGDL